MPTFQTIIVDDDVGVERRLADFSLIKEQILAVADVAKRWADDASPLMPLNAPGTLAYIHGVAELRRQFLDTDWTIDRTSGIEGVVNRRAGIRVVFQNVDRACDPIFKPHPRTSKGSGAESLSGPTLFEYAGIEPGPIIAIKLDGLTTYYVMVGEDGSAEFSCPVVEHGMFVAFPERIFVRRTKEDWVDEIDSESPIDDFEVSVSFKNEV